MIAPQRLSPLRGSLFVNVSRASMPYTFNRTYSMPNALQGKEPGAIKHWKAERYVSFASLAILPSAVVIGASPILDVAIAVIFPLHAYWGINQVVIDYLHGTTKKVTGFALAATSIGTAAGLLYFNATDIGITKAIELLWSL